MEETNKVIDISVGVIIFIIALSVNVFLYVSINKSIKEVLSINNTDSGITVSQNDINSEYVEYSTSEIFFMVQDMIEKTDKDNEKYIEDEYSPYHNDIVISLWDNAGRKTRQWKTLQSFFDETTLFAMKGGVFDRDGKYKVEYTYEYNELNNLNLSNHKIIEIKFTKM